MKTFRLVSLMVLHQDEQPSRIEEIPLIDGLIINQEDGENSWIVEAFIEKSYKSIFEKAKQNDTKLNLQVTISKKSNDPASLMGEVKIIKDMDNSVSVLLEGNLVPSRLNMAEIVLTDLIQQGLQGEGLLAEFKNRLQEKKKPIQS
ncbi:YwpF-like family protein [Fredinandcohnia sp. QZ13]|uniref:YwpF-like family protein n=1 Tax=Fredinandcohnia sp. QZ13 TaxID=3073144 RepID=UPI0028531CBF|nr:YwpF-like family protein [Fredinandcohnia sp. QZ13]MDR4890163.1 YwpF-like family protein [Fredinandcohnia sp. QZ13]